MADEKISAMTPAGDMGNADVVPIVQGGVNFKATRAQVLTGGASEDITLKASAGATAILENEDGTVRFWVEANQTVGLGPKYVFAYGPSLAQQLTMFDDGHVEFTFADNTSFLISDAGGNSFINIDSSTGTMTFSCNNGMDGNITNITAGSWSFSPPAQLSEAINRLAAAVAGLLGGTIP